MARLPRLHPRLLRTGAASPPLAGRQASPGPRHPGRSRRNQWPLWQRAMVLHQAALPRSPLPRPPHRPLPRPPGRRRPLRHLRPPRPRFRSRRPRHGQGRPRPSGARLSPARGKGKDRAPLLVPGRAPVVRRARARGPVTTPTARPRPGWGWRPVPQHRRVPASRARPPGARLARVGQAARGPAVAPGGRPPRMWPAPAARGPAGHGPARATCRRARQPAAVGQAAARAAAAPVPVPVPAVAVAVPARARVQAAVAAVHPGRAVSAAVAAGAPVVRAAVAAAAPRARSAVPAGGRRAAASRVSSGARSSTTCRPRRSAACRSRAATGR